MDLVDMVKFWISCINPENFREAMVRQKGKGDLIEASRNILISAIIMAIPMGLVVILLGSMPGGSVISPEIVVAYVIVSVIIAPISFLITQGIYWIIARLLGGKGEYRVHAYFASFFTAGIYILSILAVIPCLGAIVSLVLLVIVCYLEYALIMQVHGLGKWRAAFAVLLPFMLMLIVAIAVMLYLTPVMVSSGSAPVPVQIQ